MANWRVTVDYGDHGLVELGDVMGNDPVKLELKIMDIASTLRSLGGRRYIIHREGEGPKDSLGG